MRKGFNFYRSYWEVANELSDKDRLAFYDSLFQKQFNNCEPNLNGMAKFAYLSQKHSIDAQIKGYFDKTKDEKFNPYQDPSVGGMVGGYVPPSVQEKEKEKEKEKEQYVFDFKKSLISFGFDLNLVLEWLKIRKTKKSVNSEIAFNGFIREVEKSHLSKNEILKLCIEKSWKGFESSWVEPPKQEIKNIEFNDKPNKFPWQ